MKNTIFISYAGEDSKIAEHISVKINEFLGDNYHSELVENEREGDTTFTEKVINYFKKCNVFIVILTKYSIPNQFVNQEWGYAKSLKELGQIQLIQHIAEKYENVEEIDDNDIELYTSEGQIISKGFISSNMEFINLLIKDGKYNLDNVSMELNSFLKKKQVSLRPIFTEIQQKIIRFYYEFNRNKNLIKNLISNKNRLFPIDIIENMVKEKRYHYTEEEKKQIEELGTGILILDPKILSFDYALQLINIGHLLDTNFIDKIEGYIIKGKELNEWKILSKQWAVSRGIVNPNNTHIYFQNLDIMKEKSDDLEKDLLEFMGRYEIDL